MTLLTQNSSTNIGADLWIIPELEKSHSASKLDWYLNFQLTRSTAKVSKSLSEDLVLLLRKCGLPESHYNQDTRGKLLINSSQLLPNRWVVQLENSADLHSWCDQIGEIWTGLRKPTLRVFLPTGLTSGEFLSAWKQSQSFDDFSLVVD